MTDNFFTPVANTKPFFKAAFQGFAGSGKTYTAAEVALGLWKKIGSKKPIVIFDTEKAAKFLKDKFAAAGAELLVRESKSLKDLQETMERCRAGAAAILIIDSISHVWERFLQDYQEQKKRTRLEFQDWGVIKPMWKRLFSDPFVQDPTHIIMTGRAGWEYDNEMNKETGKRDIFKSGVKMKVEGETAYEPDLLVNLEIVTEMDGEKILKSFRTAFILKDRSTVIDGKVFSNPTFKDFEPAIDVMLADPSTATHSEEGKIEFEFRTEEEKYEYRREKDKRWEEIDGLLNRIFPSAVGKDRASRLEALTLSFGTPSETAIRDMNLEDIKNGFRKLMDLLVEIGVAHWGEKEGRKILFVVQKPGSMASTPQAGETPGNGQSAPENAGPKNGARAKKPVPAVQA